MTEATGDIWKTVLSRTFEPYEKFGSSPAVLVKYGCAVDEGSSPSDFKEWVPVENPKMAGLVERWWKQHGGRDPVPTAVAEALERVAELRATEAIRVQPAGKFWRITGRRLAAKDEASHNLTISGPN